MKLNFVKTINPNFNSTQKILTSGGEGGLTGWIDKLGGVAGGMEERKYGNFWKFQIYDYWTLLINAAIAQSGFLLVMGARSACENTCWISFCHFPH